MTRLQQPAVTLIAIGLIGLGILALTYHDFALVWQPVPESLLGRVYFAYASGILMLLCGLGLLLEATAAWSARILFPYLIIWSLLKVPAIFAAPKMEAVWLGLGELVVLMTGGWFLFAKLGKVTEDSPLVFLTGKTALTIARILFAVSLLPIGLSHIVYVQATVDYVPAWLPYRVGWAYLTGAGHIAAGLGVLFGVLPRIAAWCEAAMISIFTLLVWAPAILAAPKERLPWTAFFISWAIAAAAFSVAQNISPKPAANSQT